MCFVHLDGRAVVQAGCRKRGANGGSACIDRVADKVAVEAIFGEILVDSYVVLLGVVEAVRTEVAVIENRRTTGYVVGAWGAAAGVRGEVLRSESILSRA